MSSHRLTVTPTRRAVRAETRSTTRLELGGLTASLSLVALATACSGNWWVPPPPVVGEAAPAEAAPVDPATPITNDTLCRAVAEAFMTRCGIDPAVNDGQAYRWCLSSSDANATALFNYGQMNQCTVDIGAVGQCEQMEQGVLPASCVPASPAPVEVAVDPGGVTVGAACNRLMEEHCNRCRPNNMAVCVANSLQWCHNGRDVNFGTGMSEPQYKKCRKAYLGLNCTVSEDQGYVPMDCAGLR